MTRVACGCRIVGCYCHLIARGSCSGFQGVGHEERHAFSVHQKMLQIFSKVFDQESIRTCNELSTDRWLPTTALKKSFAKLLWPEDSKDIFSQAATCCSHVYHTRWTGGDFTSSLLMLNVKQGSCEYQF